MRDVAERWARGARQGALAYPEFERRLRRAFYSSSEPPRISGEAVAVNGPAALAQPNGEEANA